MVPSQTDFTALCRRATTRIASNSKYRTVQPRATMYISRTVQPHASIESDEDMRVP